MSAFLHYATIGLAVGINSIAVGLGEGLTGKAALKATHLQPSAQHDITKTAILGMALIETAAILGFSIAFILLLGSSNYTTIYPGIAELGIAFAICISGFVAGIASSWPAQAACLATARQPFFSQKILRFMLLTQTIIQTPIIFGFLVAMVIKNQATSVADLPNALRLLASGLAIGLGGIGPAVGLGVFGKAAIEGLGINRNSYNQLFSFTIISEAIIETPAIFALIVSIPLLGLSLAADNMTKGVALVAAALAIGLSTIGPGISSGKTAASACTQIARNPENYSTLSRVSMFGQGLIDTCAIYGLLVSLGLIFLV